MLVPNTVLVNMVVQSQCFCVSGTVLVCSIGGCTTGYKLQLGNTACTPMRVPTASCPNTTNSGPVHDCAHGIPLPVEPDDVGVRSGSILRMFRRSFASVSCYHIYIQYISPNGLKSRVHNPQYGNHHKHTVQQCDGLQIRAHK
jgi:hypothetical protein